MKNKALYSSIGCKWNTPKKIIDHVISVLGTIDLDPCSNSQEFPNVPATKHYVENDDGLSKLWFGRIYMNPPYGRGIKEWVTKLDKHFQNKDVIEAIALVPARPDTQWFRVLQSYPVCFVEGRLHFPPSPYPAPFPSAVFYLGNNLGAFYNEFVEVGDIYCKLNY